MLRPAAMANHTELQLEPTTIGVQFREKGNEFEDMIRDWLAKLPDLIDQGSLEIIKLGLRSELKQVQLDTVRSVTDLYDVLQRVYDNPEKVFARLVYALTLLGHRRYGKLAIRKLLQRPPKFNPLTSLPQHVDPERFFLHQCLATVCRVIPEEGDTIGRFIKHVAKLMGVNPKTLKTPCEALVKLLELDRISYENYLDLIEVALIKCGVSESIIKEYLKSCEEISCCHWRTSTCSLHGSSRTLSSCTTVNEFGDCVDKQENGTSSINASTILHYRHRQIKTQSDLSPLPSILRRPKSVRLKNFCLRFRTKLCDTISRNFLIMLCHMLIVAALLSSGLIFWLYPTPVDTVTLYRSNTTAIVANTSLSLEVMLDVSYPGDYEHTIELYQVTSTCSNLPTLDETYTQMGYNFSAANLTTYYALAGSSIVFDVCGSDNSINSYPKRLEVVVVKSLEDLQSTETILQNFYRAFYFLPGIDGKWTCKKFVFDIDAYGYYTVIFLPLPSMAVFNYTMTYKIKSVDLTKTPIGLTSTLRNDQERWTLPVKRGFNLDHDSCIVASIENNVDTSIRNVHIQTHYNANENYNNGQYTVIASLVYFIIGCVIIFILCLPFRKKGVRFPVQDLSVDDKN